MRPLALKGRQITDGGKQCAAPGRGKLITPPPCADGAREGQEEGVAVERGLRFAHPRLYSVALVPGGFATGAFAGLKAQRRHCQRRCFVEEAALKRYLSLSRLFGALACYLSFSCLSFQK